VAGSTATTPFRAPGQWEDLETGLHYNRYRYYDPEVGRYISPDPIGFDGGYNLYEYGPNPIGWADPMGWQHQMTVTTNGAPYVPGGTNNQSGPGYTSGMQATQPCPTDLNSQARAHTEQKFAYDLMRDPNVQPGQQFQLTGTYPPCPTCHAALRTAAAKTGTKVTYSWENPKGTVQGSVTYDGKADPVFSQDPHAQQIAGAYGNQYQSGNYWGYSSPGAYQAYSNLMNTGGYRPPPG
jgi:RHS repeat-associated protein